MRTAWSRVTTNEQKKTKQIRGHTARMYTCSYNNNVGDEAARAYTPLVQVDFVIMAINNSIFFRIQCYREILISS